MHKQLFTTFLSSAFICLSLSLSTFHTQAATARSSITKLQSEGFRACKSIGSGGWTGLVRAESLDGNSRGGNRAFSIRYCFSSQSECQQFVNNIERIVSNVDTVRLRKCKPK